jgi:general secretion pathway protein D
LTTGDVFHQAAEHHRLATVDHHFVINGASVEGWAEAGVSKVPLLGDIPLVGQLFRYTSQDTSKRNLMVFIPSGHCGPSLRY